MTAVWWIVLAGPFLAPLSIIRASRVMARARFITSSGIVAEKSSVWRAAGSSDRMRVMSGQKPMSIIRSASSSTRTTRPEKSVMADRMWSINRPGVATTMSTPARSARS